MIDDLTSPDLKKGEASLDINQYRYYTLYWKGQNDPRDTIWSPYTNRPLQPYLASFIPAPPNISINVINTFATFLTLYIVMWLARRDSGSDSAPILAGYLFVLSFPVFYYSTTGNIDATTMGFIALVVFLHRKKWESWALPLFFVSVFQKETALLAFFYIAGSYLSRYGYKKALSWTTIYGLTGMLAYFLSRSLFPSGNAIWVPGTDFISDNIFRFRAYASVALSLGVPALVILWKRKNIAIKRDLPYLATFSGLFLLVLYAFTSAYLDGRFILVGYTFLSSFAAILYSRQKKAQDRQ